MKDTEVLNHIANIKTQREIKHVFLYGVFTEVCVLQTSMHLQDYGYHVWLVREGITSISALDK